MRLFVAVPLPLELARSAAALLPQHRGLRPVAPEVMHVTLAFLGATDPERLGDVGAAASEAARGIAPFRARVDRIGRFPERGQPRVVWLGIGEGADELTTVADRLRAALASRAIEFDAKPFRAHVTLARVRDEVDRAQARGIAHAVDALHAPDAAFDVTAIVVFESVVSSKGPRYTARATATLGGRDEPGRSR